MNVRETVEISGHLIDTGILSRVLDDVREYGGDWVIDKFDVGHEAADLSSAKITISTPDDEALQRLLMRLQTRGVNQVDPGTAETAACEQDGVFPDFFYSTTNLETRVRLEGRWVRVEHPGQDAGVDEVAGDLDGLARVHRAPRTFGVVDGRSGPYTTAPSSPPQPSPPCRSIVATRKTKPPTNAATRPMDTQVG